MRRLGARKRSHLGLDAAGAAILIVAIGGIGCTTRETGFIELAASAAPPAKPPKPMMPMTCAVDKDCPKPMPRCAPATGLCVECASDAECSDPVKPRCETATGMCVECFDDVDCVHDPMRAVCDVPLRHCVGCVADAGCPPGEHCAMDSMCRAGP